MYRDLAGLPSALPTESLEAWWQRCRADGDRYRCFAVILALPTDEEAIRYLSDFAGELDVLSGEHCVILFFGGEHFRRFGLDEDFRTLTRQHAQSRHSARIGRAFGIDFEDMPCMLFFRDLSSSDCVVVKLKGLLASEISSLMRSLFSAIDEAVYDDRDVLDALRSTKALTAFLRTSAGAAGKLGGIAGKTLEVVMQAWVKAMLKL